MARPPGERLVKACFLVIASLAAISCIVRPDYNLPLFAFLWWKFFDIPAERAKRHRVLLLVFIGLSCIQDVIYLCYWPGRWMTSAWVSVSDSTQTWHGVVLGLGWVELVLKCILLTFILLPRDQMWIPWKTDEFEEVEVTTYHQTPPPTRVYARID